MKIKAAKNISQHANHNVNHDNENHYHVENTISESQEMGTNNVNSKTEIHKPNKRSVAYDENKIRKKRRKKMDDEVDSTESKNDTIASHEQSKDTSIKKNNVRAKDNEEGSGEDSNLESENEELQNENNVDKQTELLNGKFLRASFNSDNGLVKLKQFLQIASENKEKDISAEYLDAGGNILEVLRVLNVTDKKKIGTAATVFSAIKILLMKILKQYPHYQSSAEEACRHLINSHLSVLHAMLSVQSNTKQRKIVLQLLTAMVSLGGNLPRELLAQLTFQSQVIESLVKQTKPTDSQSVRTCFIHFIISFLVEGNVLTIRTFLEKHHLLSSIFPELIYDSKDIVILVLSTIKTYILENSGISKTMKLHVFSTSVVQNLVSLYNWKGPKSWPKNKVQEPISSPEYLEEKEVVTNIVHEFLTTLLTSHRYGIIFHDRTLGTSRTKHNQLVNTVLQSLDRPWEFEKPANLVINIMTACPDLIKSQLTLVESYIEPRVSIKWIKLMKFIRKIIESVDADTSLKTCSLELNALQLAEAVMSLSVPGTILKNAIIPSLTHDNIIVRHEAILVLTVMFNQVHKLSCSVKTIYKDNIDFCVFRNHTIEYITKNIPNIDLILKVWNNAFELSVDANELIEKDTVLEPRKHDHLNSILNLLHMYSDIFPELLNITLSSELSTLLTTLDKLDDIDMNELNTMKIKAIQFLVAFDSIGFAPDKKMFSNILSFLISLLNKEELTIILHAKVTIKQILNATGLFEACNEELNIWIDGFINLESSDERKEMTHWFLRTIKKTVQHPEKYINRIIDTEEIVNDQVISGSKLQDIFDELQQMDNIGTNFVNNSLRMQRLTSISPLLCCMLSKMKKESSSTLLRYMSYVLIHTLHCQVTPQCLIHLAKDIEKLPIQKYLLSWVNNNEVASIPKVLPSMTTICKFDSALSTNEEIRFVEIFNGDSSCTFKYNDQNITINYSLSTHEIMCFLRMTIFYLVQFSERGTLTDTQNENCKILLISLLYIAKENADKDSMIIEECVKHIFTHPIILHYFSPFCQKNKVPMKYMITITLIDVITVIVQLYEKCKRNSFLHFKNKLFAELYTMLEKNRRGDKLGNIEAITTLFELLQPTGHDIVCLLSKLMKLESSMFISKNKLSLSIYGHIVPKLLEMTCSEKMRSERTMFFQLNKEFVSPLCIHLLFLKSIKTINYDSWEMAMWKYFSNFPFNIIAVNTSTFSSLLATNITNASTKLISLLIGRNNKFIPIFIDYVMKNENVKKDTIFSVITSNLTYKWNQAFLEKLKEHCHNEIVSYLSDRKDVSWIEENTEAISYLIENTFDLKLCEDTCSNILQIGDKLELVPVSYICLLQSLHKKYATLSENDDSPVTNFLHILLHIITLTLKKEPKNVEKIDTLLEKVKDTVNHMKKKRSDFTLESLSNNNSWPQFTRFSLKLGLKQSKGGEQQVSTLKVLNILCDIAYKNDCDNEYVKTLFEMATSHSEFFDIMLGSSTTKRYLIELLWILMQKNKSIIAITHIPVYLAAYNATLSETDQLVLLILQYYEKNDINMHKYRPYLWGNAAALHYSVKDETHMALWRQPSTSQVLNLFEKEMINNTVKYYPLNRALMNHELNEANNVYDPAFYLPLLCFLLAENNVVSCHKITQSGALSLVFVACSSSNSEIRMAAYTIISRFYAHLESSSSKAKLLWMRLIDALRYGLTSLKLELNNVRLSCLVSTFLAQASLIASQPLHLLYSPLQTFLMAKPALDINAIPELLQLFHSSDVDYKTHRHWILEVIRDGMKIKDDVKIAFKCVLFKMLFDFYTSNLSDSNTKRLILEVISSTTKISAASILLIRGHALLPWLYEVTKDLHTHGVQHIESAISIVNNLSNVVLCTKEVVHYKFMLLQITLNLKSNLSKDINISSFTSYVNVLQKLITFKDMKMSITKEDLESVLKYSKRFLNDIDECEDMLNHGCEYIVKTNFFKSENNVEIAKHSLKMMLWTWCGHGGR